MRPTPYQAFVRIKIGCDKFCTYCIVPSVRGPEQSRPAADIVAEARQLAGEGCREITLLGQTVNSYRYRDGERTTRLSDLLAALHEIDGLERLKFVTNYPKDMTDDLLAAVRDLPKARTYLHVPAQSGSNDVLQRMKRGYTVEDYREMLEPHSRVDSRRVGDQRLHRRLLRRDRRRLSDDRATWSASAASRTASSSSTANAPAPRAPSSTPTMFRKKSKRRRNNELLALQNEISEEDNHASSAGRSRCWSKAPAKPPNAAAHDARSADSDPTQPRNSSAARLRPDRRLRRQPPPSRPNAADLDLRRQRPHPLRRRRHPAFGRRAVHAHGTGQGIINL